MRLEAHFSWLHFDVKVKCLLWSCHQDEIHSSASSYTGVTSVSLRCWCHSGVTPVPPPYTGVTPVSLQCLLLTPVSLWCHLGAGVTPV